MAYILILRGFEVQSFTKIDLFLQIIMLTQVGMFGLDLPRFYKKFTNYRAVIPC